MVHGGFVAFCSQLLNEVIVVKTIARTEYRGRLARVQDDGVELREQHDHAVFICKDAIVSVEHAQEAMLEN